MYRRHPRSSAPGCERTLRAHSARKCSASATARSKSWWPVIENHGEMHGWPLPDCCIQPSQPVPALDSSHAQLADALELSIRPSRRLPRSWLPQLTLRTGRTLNSIAHYPCMILIFIIPDFASAVRAQLAASGLCQRLVLLAFSLQLCVELPQAEQLLPHRDVLSTP